MSKVAAKQNNKKNLTISIKQNGEISFDTTVVLIENIETKLCDYEADIPIYINCDKNAKFDHFVVLIDILKQKNFTNLGIITKKD